MMPRSRTLAGAVAAAVLASLAATGCASSETTTTEPSGPRPIGPVTLASFDALWGDVSVTPVADGSWIVAWTRIENQGGHQSVTVARIDAEGHVETLHAIDDATGPTVAVDFWGVSIAYVANVTTSPEIQLRLAQEKKPLAPDVAIAPDQYPELFAVDGALLLVGCKDDFTALHAQPLDWTGELGTPVDHVLGNYLCTGTRGTAGLTDAWILASDYSGMFPGQMMVRLAGDGSMPWPIFNLGLQDTVLAATGSELHMFFRVEADESVVPGPGQEKTPTVRRKVFYTSSGAADDSVEVGPLAGGMQAAASPGLSHLVYIDPDLRTHLQSFANGGEPLAAREPAEFAGEQKTIQSPALGATDEWIGYAIVRANDDEESTRLDFGTLPVVP